MLLEERENKKINNPITENRIDFFSIKSDISRRKITNTNKLVICLGSDLYDLQINNFYKQRIKVLSKARIYKRPLFLIFQSDNNKYIKKDLEIKDPLLSIFLKDFIKGLKKSKPENRKNILKKLRVDDDKIIIFDIQDVQMEGNNLYIINTF